MRSSINRFSQARIVPMWRARPVFAVALALVLVMLGTGALGTAGCSHDLGPQAVGIQALKLSNFAPAALGTPSHPATFTSVKFDIAAIGPDGKTLAQDFDVDVFLTFSGNKVGVLNNCGKNEDATPLTVVHLTAGVAQNVTATLVKTYGSATIWAEEHITKALGSSDVMYFAQPTISDIQTPAGWNDMPMPSTVSYCSQWSGRHVIVNSATGAGGQIIVTSVFGNSYVILDTGAMYDPMTGLGGFNAMDIFTFGQPPDTIVPGLVMLEISGNVAKFNGFTELNFPLQSFDGRSIDGSDHPRTVLPAGDLRLVPFLIDSAYEGKLAQLLPIAAYTVKTTGTICPVDVKGDQWVKYNSVVINLANGHPCSDTFNSFALSLPAKVFGAFDPLTAGAATYSITGMLQNNSGQNEACKGIGPSIVCQSSLDCSNAAGDATLRLSAGCQANLVKAGCVEGTCRRGVYNFWSIVPRTSADIFDLGMGH